MTEVDIYKNLSYRLENNFYFFNIVPGWSKTHHDAFTQGTVHANLEALVCKLALVECPESKNMRGPRGVFIIKVQLEDRALPTHVSLCST